MISKARQDITVINQGFLAFEDWTAQQFDSDEGQPQNKFKRQESRNRCIQASITLTQTMRAEVDIYCISSQAVGYQ